MKMEDSYLVSLSLYEAPVKFSKIIIKDNTLKFDHHFPEIIVYWSPFFDFVPSNKTNSMEVVKQMSVVGPQKVIGLHKLHFDTWIR